MSDSFPFSAPVGPMRAGAPAAQLQPESDVSSNIRRHIRWLV